MPFPAHLGAHASHLEEVGAIEELTSHREACPVGIAPCAVNEPWRKQSWYGKANVGTHLIAVEVGILIGVALAGLPFVGRGNVGT